MNEYLWRFWGVEHGRHRFCLLFHDGSVLSVPGLARLQHLPRHRLYDLQFAWSVIGAYRFLHNLLFQFPFSLAYQQAMKCLLCMEYTVHSSHADKI